MLATVDGSARGRFALVCYVPEPLGSAIDKLVGHLSTASRPEAHITILPPRPLVLPLEDISSTVRSMLEQLPVFDVDLSEVCRFDGTNVLYLNLADGHEIVHRLHDALNTGILAYEEPFEFHPHLTLTDPLPEADVEVVQRRAELLWSSFSVTRFPVNEIVFLWAAPGDPKGHWQRQWSIPLRKASPAQSGL